MYDKYFMLDINTIVYKLPIEVDNIKLLCELEALVLPFFKQKSENSNWRSQPKSSSISITGHPDTPLDNWFNANNGPMHIFKDSDTGEVLTKDYDNYTLGFPGPWRREVIAYYEDSVRSDRDLIAWHPSLLNSEMFRLRNAISDFFKIDNNLRCRTSFIGGPPPGVTRIPMYHSDPHTPWRVHIAMKTGPKTKWFFRNAEQNKIIDWHQPTGGVYLIRTGNVQHAIDIGVNEVRWQLFYHIWQRDLGPNYHQIA